MLNKYTVDKLRTAMKETFFKDWDHDYLKSATGLSDIEDHTYRRYDICLHHVVPWVSSAEPFGSCNSSLRESRMLEIGCGTGSSTAAFAQSVKHIHGYDIHAPSVDAARRRCEILGIQNVHLEITHANSLLELIREQCHDGIEIALLYAVLEHMTISERIETIKTCWNLLSPGGVLVVFETPNRLFFEDNHTSLLPFFHTLPPELAAAYAVYSPRKEFRESMRKKTNESMSEYFLRLERWGRGVSYHEFDIALQLPLSDLVVTDGFSANILEIVPLTSTEGLLRAFVESTGMNLDLAFTRPYIDVILRKPGAKTDHKSDRQFPLNSWVPRAKIDEAEAIIKLLKVSHKELNSIELASILLAKLKHHIKNPSFKEFSAFGRRFAEKLTSHKKK